MALSFNAKMKRKLITVANNYGKADAYVHSLAMEIANHAKEHNDCTMAQNLVMAMPASARRSMLILWFATFTPIVTKNNDKFESKARKPDDKNYVPYDLVKGDATPFYELAKENKEPALLDSTKAIAKVKNLAKSLTKSLDEGNVNDDDKAYVKGLIAALTSLKIDLKGANDDNDTKSNVKRLVNGDLVF